MFRLGQWIFADYIYRYTAIQFMYIRTPAALPDPCTVGCNKYFSTCPVCWQWPYQSWKINLTPSLIKICYISSLNKSCVDCKSWT
jgi:hypothetical protein